MQSDLCNELLQSDSQKRKNFSGYLDILSRYAKELISNEDPQRSFVFKISVLIYYRNRAFYPLTNTALQYTKQWGEKGRKINSDNIC